LSCCVVFANGDLQREHYRTEWHRYNLERRTAQLSPISADQFSQKAADFVQEQGQGMDDDGSKLYCASCKKEFRSRPAFENHLRSKKHRRDDTPLGLVDTPLDHVDTPLGHVDTPLGHGDTPLDHVDTPLDHVDNMNEADSEEQWSDIEEGEGDELNETEAIPLGQCLFCPVNVIDLDASLGHMSKSHGFSIPDAQFCVDMEGLVRYLGLKVGGGHLCLWCNERGRKFRSLDACRKHMRDMAHCRIRNETDDLLELSDFYDYGPAEVESSSSTEELVIPLDMLDGNEWQLVLPSGAVVGHRSLMRYYKQRLKPLSNNERSITTTSSSSHVIAHRLPGTVIASTPMAIQRAKDIRFMKRIVAKKQLQLGLKANKLFQFRGREE